MIKTAVILAAGGNARLSHVLSDRPKGFIEIDGCSLIERSVQSLLNHRIERIIIGTGYLSHHYERFAQRYDNIVTHKNEFFASSGSFFTLYNLKNIIQEDFVLLESDLIYEDLALTHVLHNELDDIILASGRTFAGDEVFIETDQHQLLVKMSKKEEELAHIFGELVGISKISLKTYQSVCDLFSEKYDLLTSIEYEYAFTRLARTHPIKIEKIEGLVWAEIDTEEHLKRVRNVIYPKLKTCDSGRYEYGDLI